MTAIAGLTVPVAGVSPSPAHADVLDIPQALIGVLAQNLGLLTVDVLPNSDVMAALPEGESLPVYRLDASAIVLNGLRYVVSLDPTTLPADYLDSSGIATFQMSAINILNGNLNTTIVSARAVQLTPTSAPVWTDAVGSADDVPGNDESDGARTTGNGISSRSRVPITRTLKARDVGPTQVGALTSVSGAGDSRSHHRGKKNDKKGTSSRYTAAAAETAGNCSGAGPRITKVASSLPYATLGTTYPVGNSTAFMKVSSSKGAEYGIGVSASGTKGTFSASGTKFSQSGWGKEWNPLANSRSYQKQVEYYKWKYEYLDSRCNHYHWIPNTETGGTASNVGIERPTWTSWCTNEDPGPWWRDSSSGSAYSYDAAVKFTSVIGIDLSIKRNYSSSQYLQYNIVGSKKLCGSNTWPSNASKLMERTR